AQRNVVAERNWFGTVVEERNHRPVNTTCFGNPRRPFTAPQRQRLAAEVVAVQTFKSFFGVRQPVRLETNVVIGHSDNFALRRLDTRVERGRTTLLRFLEVMERNRKGFLGFPDHLARVVLRVVINDQDFPRLGHLDGGQRLKRSGQLVRAVIGGDDYRKLHGSTRRSSVNASANSNTSEFVDSAPHTSALKQESKMYSYIPKTRRSSE